MGYWIMNLRELDAIQKRIHESDAYKRVRRVEDLRPSLTIFQGNFADLRRCILPCEKDPRLLDLRRRQDVHDLLHELSRTLHNFAASAMGLWVSLSAWKRYSHLLGTSPPRGYTQRTFQEISSGPQAVWKRGSKPRGIQVPSTPVRSMSPGMPWDLPAQLRQGQARSG